MRTAEMARRRPIPGGHYGRRCLRTLRSPQASQYTHTKAGAPHTGRDGTKSSVTQLPSACLRETLTSRTFRAPAVPQTLVCHLFLRTAYRLKSVVPRRTYDGQVLP